VQIRIGISVKGKKTSGPPSNPVNTVPPVISGGQVVGSTLTLTSVGSYTGAVPITYTYQWYRGINLIVGQTSTTYITQEADAGLQVACQVQASNAYGSNFVSSNYLLMAALSAPENLSLPAIDALTTYYVDYTLSFTGNEWSGNPVPTLTYQWLRNGGAIGGETFDIYIATYDDVGQNISVKCTATNSQGTDFVISNEVLIEP
jgi:hypothetical protein